jgi:hypothetical protein
MTVMGAYLGDLSFEVLDRWLERTPVVVQVHPLVPLCLNQNVDIVLDADLLLQELDHHLCTETQAKMILSDNAVLKTRFPWARSLDQPPISVINQNMRYHLDYARQHLLTTHKVAAFIEDDVRLNRYQLVVLLLVDGLSYENVRNWNTNTIPCFVDGPSVTYRFHNGAKDELVRQVGFVSITNYPSIYQRLYRFGYHHARGYTYWEPKDNIIADYMFTGVPFQRVANFEAIVQQIQREVFPPYTYLQIVREGLDGLAHGKRELHRSEIDGAIQAIADDIEQLLNSLKRTGFSTCVYVTADHGVLWKNEHPWQHLRLPDSKPRYITHHTELGKNHTVRFENGGVPYYLLCYPYLGSPIRASDSGVHGGLSYQESIVPFMKFQV